ncbi:MAG: YggS family pyridoxal phosphate-dependent enzyme [Paludibacteraceae bacterium]
MIRERIAAIRAGLMPDVRLICVSKYHPVEAIEEAYQAGERDFAESRVQELLQKQAALPKDIRWHFIGHLQTNKVRAIVPFVNLIQSVDSVRLLETIEKECARIDRIVDVLLEVHVAQEESKSGFLPSEIEALLQTDLREQYPHMRFRGIMGMATNTDDEAEIRRCFRRLSEIFEGHKAGADWDTLSMGMSEDYEVAIACGANMVRIGSTIFGERSSSPLT